MKKKTYTIISIIVFILVMAVLALISVPLISSVNNPEKLKTFIESLGIWGIFIMFLIQLAQIIVAIIPGEVVEFVSGALYGWFGGFIFCMLGIIAGQSLIFTAVKHFGSDFSEKIAGSKTMTRFKFLQNERKLKALVFFLFFIPGTPKDILTYIVPLTKIKLRDFIILSSIARTPSVLSSTWAGDAFAEQNFILLAVVYAGIAVFTIVGGTIYRYTEKKRAIHNEDNEAVEEKENEILNVK